VTLTPSAQHQATGRAVSAAAAFGAGVVVAVQGRINGELGTVTGNGVLAAAVNFTVGLTFLLLIVMARPSARRAARALPGSVRAGRLPWWALTGGLGGAAYVSGQGVTIAALGVALFTIATVAGQTGLSLAVDRWGLGPTGAVPVTVARVLAAVLATAAVWLASGGRGDGGAGSKAYLLLAFLAGAAVAFQAAFNGRVAMATGEPTVAALVNFVVGLTALGCVLLVQAVATGGGAGSLAPVADQPWLLVGGLMGLLFVVTAAWTVRALGVLLFSLVVLAGTLIGAVAADLVVPTDGAQLTGNLLAGIGLTAVSVGLAVVRRR
jgi:transporter family-2 protein